MPGLILTRSINQIILCRDRVSGKEFEIRMGFISSKNKFVIVQVANKRVRLNMEEPYEFGNSCLIRLAKIRNDKEVKLLILAPPTLTIFRKELVEEKHVPIFYQAHHPAR